ncbi:MAG TPA: CoA-binding protein [Casimicrobiaceae bacterium]|nr:CoA-binding protein [Casimicrobiaceae bacterium]
MSILVDASTRILVQGLTGSQASVDSQRALRYGARIVAGVTPGRGGEAVHGIAVYDSVAEAIGRHEIDATILYMPPLAVRDAALEAIEQRIPLLIVTAEGVPLHDATYVIAAARAAGVKLVGCNTNGVISPGRGRIGGIGGEDPSEIYEPGRIGICSRSGGMSAELARTLKFAGWGVSTCVSMGGDRITGLRMSDYALLFQDDPETDAIVVFGEPGTGNERGLADVVRDGRVTKPVVALVAGIFQEAYPAGRSFGHAAALVREHADTASAKIAMLREAGARVATTLDEIPHLLNQALHEVRR